jgi:hypothetical protein
VGQSTSICAVGAATRGAGARRSNRGIQEHLSEAVNRYGEAQTEQVFTLYRPWLMDLFAVVEAKDRAALLAALDRVQASFKP